MLNKNMIIYNILILGSIFILVLGCIRYSNSNLFLCNNIIIAGCDLSNEQNIKNQFEYLKNKSILDLNKNEIITKLINNDFISSADIAIILPNTIIISILEVEPISIIKLHNSSFLVDANSNGYLYNDKSSVILGIPVIYASNIDNLNNAFKSPEYEFLKNIYLDYYSLYEKINHMKILNSKIVASFNINNDNSIVYFDSSDFYKQIQYFDSFLHTLDRLDQKYYYEYIKFAGETIVVKEERNI
tara:strand:+ start:176 stop:907 length:732 start_codon:yes stop_codon:yes gene_type:complete